MGKGACYGPETVASKPREPWRKDSSDSCKLSLDLRTSVLTWVHACVSVSVRIHEGKINQ